MRSISKTLVDCKIPQKDITSWVSEPWHINNIRHAIKWVDQYLIVEINRLIETVNMYPDWTLLIVQRHPHVEKLREAQRRVKETWFKRPRYKKDRGRVAKEGY